MSRVITFAKAVNEALYQAMEQDPDVICYGLGVPDPKGVFGTTSGLQERFGKERVFDMPISENAMTGIAIGAALNGTRVVMTHQRLDFFLLAMDQLVNNAAKWHYMFGGVASVPITIRLILGMGWGQGPTHSQSLQSWFAHVPGLKVVMPSTPADAKGLLLSSIFDDNPVVFLEHRWLHNQNGDVPETPDFRVPLGSARIMRKGEDITIIGMSYMSIEAARAADYLKKHNVNCEVIDIRSIKPVDWKLVFDSVRRTGKLLALDTASEPCSFAGELIARVSSELFSSLKAPPVRLALPDTPSPTSFALTEHYYKTAGDIAFAAAAIAGMKIPEEITELKRQCPHDVPGEWFKGPF